MDVIRDRQVAVLRERNLEFLERAGACRALALRGRRRAPAPTSPRPTPAARQRRRQLAAARAQALSSAATYHQVVGEEPGKLTPRAPLAKGCCPRASIRRIVIANTEHPAILATEHLVDAAGFSVKSAEGALLPQLSAIGRRVARLPQHGPRMLHRQ